MVLSFSLANGQSMPRWAKYVRSHADRWSGPRCGMQSAQYSLKQFRPQHSQKFSLLLFNLTSLNFSGHLQHTSLSSSTVLRKTWVMPLIIPALQHILPGLLKPDLCIFATSSSFGRLL